MKIYKVKEEFIIPAVGDVEERVVAAGEEIELDDDTAQAFIESGVIEVVGDQNDNPPSATGAQANGESVKVSREEAVEAVVIGKAGGTIKIFTRDDGKDFIEQAEALAEENGFTVEFK